MFFKHISDLLKQNFFNFQNDLFYRERLSLRIWNKFSHQIFITLWSPITFWRKLVLSARLSHSIFVSISSAQSEALWRRLNLSQQVREGHRSLEFDNDAPLTFAGLPNGPSGIIMPTGQPHNKILCLQSQEQSDQTVWLQIRFWLINKLSENKPECVSSSNSLREMFNDFRGRPYRMPSFWLSEEQDRAEKTWTKPGQSAVSFPFTAKFIWSEWKNLQWKLFLKIIK